jgi:hypothetical protein
MNLENRLTALSQWAKFFDPGREDVIDIATGHMRRTGGLHQQIFSFLLMPFGRIFLDMNSCKNGFRVIPFPTMMIRKLLE